MRNWTKVTPWYAMWSVGESKVHSFGSLYSLLHWSSAATSHTQHHQPCVRVRKENSRNSWLSKLQKFFFEKFFFRDLKVTFRCGFISSTYLTSSHSDPLVAHQKPRGQSGCCSARGQGAACNRAGALGASCCLPAHLTHQWDLNIEGFCLIRVEKDNHPASCKEWRGVTNQKVGRRTKQTLLQGRHSDG